MPFSSSASPAAMPFSSPASPAAMPSSSPSSPAAMPPSSSSSASSPSSPPPPRSVDNGVYPFSQYRPWQLPQSTVEDALGCCDATLEINGNVAEHPHPDRAGRWRLADRMCTPPLSTSVRVSEGCTYCSGFAGTWMPADHFGTVSLLDVGQYFHPRELMLNVALGFFQLDDLHQRRRVRDSDCVLYDLALSQQRPLQSKAPFGCGVAVTREGEAVNADPVHPEPARYARIVYIIDQHSDPNAWRKWVVAMTRALQLSFPVKFLDHESSTGLAGVDSGALNFVISRNLTDALFAVRLPPTAVVCGIYVRGSALIGQLCHRRLPLAGRVIFDINDGEMVVSSITTALDASSFWGELIGRASECFMDETAVCVFSASLSMFLSHEKKDFEASCDKPNVYDAIITGRQSLPGDMLRQDSAEAWTGTDWRERECSGCMSDSDTVLSCGHGGCLPCLERWNEGAPYAHRNTARCLLGRCEPSPFFFTRAMPAVPELVSCEDGAVASSFPLLSRVFESLHVNPPRLSRFDVMFVSVRAALEDLPDDEKVGIVAGDTTWLRLNSVLKNIGNDAFSPFKEMQGESRKRKDLAGDGSVVVPTRVDKSAFERRVLISDSICHLARDSPKILVLCDGRGKSSYLERELHAWKSTVFMIRIV